MTTRRFDTRRHPRVEINNPVAYTCLDENGIGTQKGMARALNISKGGILLETPSLVASPFVRVGAVTAANDSLAVEGAVVYSRQADQGICRTGIRFLGAESEHLHMIKVLIRDYCCRKSHMDSGSRPAGGYMQQSAA